MRTYFMHKFLVIYIFKNQKPFFSTILIFFNLIFLFPQENLPRYVPASPSAAELGRYGQIPVGMFTGSLQYSVPLLEIGYHDFKMPISLSYSSNGINVDKYASAVGMEWSLNAVWVITRILMDEADEGNRTPLPNYTFGSSEMNTFLHGVTTTEGYDTQPDIFAFNVNGYSGKFYFDTNWAPRLIEPSPVRIEKLANYENETNYSNPDFKITTPDGIQYWFGGSSGSEYSFSRTDDLGGGGFSPPTIISKVAWYLSKIQIPNGSLIDLYYTNHTFNYNSGISQKVSGKLISGVSYVQATYKAPIVNKSYTSVSNISSIEWENGSVEFYYSTRYSGVSLKKLDSLKLFDYNDKLIKGYAMDYLVTGSNDTYDNEGAETGSKRLFLEKVTTLDSQSQAGPAYTFEYNDPYNLPPRLSFSRDLWGYFNGAQNDDLVSSDLSFYSVAEYSDTPFIYTDIQYIFSNVGGDRGANGTYGMKGLLKKVTYPTLGSSEFVYEPHSYYGDVRTYGNSIQEATSVQTGPDDFETFTNSVTITDAVEEDVDLYLYVDEVVSASSGCEAGSNPPQWINATFQVIDVTNTGSTFPIDIYSNPQNGGSPVSQGTSVNIDDNFTNSSPYFVELENGHDYEFKVTVTKPCVDAGLSFYHYSS